MLTLFTDGYHTANFCGSHSVVKLTLLITLPNYPSQQALIWGRGKLYEPEVRCIETSFL